MNPVTRTIAGYGAFLYHRKFLRISYDIKNAPLWMRLVRRCICKLKLARTSAQRVASDSLFDIASGNSFTKYLQNMYSIRIMGMHEFLA